MGGHVPLGGGGASCVHAHRHPPRPAAHPPASPPLTPPSAGRLERQVLCMGGRRQGVCLNPNPTWGGRGGRARRALPPPARPPTLRDPAPPHPPRLPTGAAGRRARLDQRHGRGVGGRGEAGLHGGDARHVQVGGEPGGAHHRGGARGGALGGTRLGARAWPLACPPVHSPACPFPRLSIPPLPPAHYFIPSRRHFLC